MFPGLGSGVELPTVTLLVKTPVLPVEARSVTVVDPTGRSPIAQVTLLPDELQLAPDHPVRNIDDGKSSMNPASVATAGPEFVTVM